MGDGMTTYNTGNPVPSTNPKDLLDNAENYDTALNDRTKSKWTDRLGRERKTYHEIERLADSNTAIAAAVRSEDARDRAEEAADLVQASSKTVWVKLYSELISIGDKESGTPGVVTSDPDSTKNGYYVWDGSVWSLTILQPASGAAVEEAQAAVDAVSQLVSSSLDGEAVTTIDDMSFIGSFLDAKSFRTGAGSLVRGDSTYRVEGVGGESLVTYIADDGDTEYAEKVVDPMSFIGMALTNDGRLFPSSEAPPPTPKNTPDAPAFNIARMRQTRMRVKRMAYTGYAGQDTKLSMGIIGDSWTDGASRYITRLTTQLMRKLGDGGGGWIGAGWNGSFSHGNARQSGSGFTPEGTRGELSPYGISDLSDDGRWVCDFTNGNGPGLSRVRSTEAGAEFVVGYFPDNAETMVQGAGAFNLARLDLHYLASSPCTIEYAWNDSETYTPLVLADSGGASIAQLGVPPTGKAWVKVRVVSGELIFYGCWAESTATRGFLMSKLGVNGSSARNWAAANSSAFVAAQANLALDLIALLLGTNDQGLGRSAEQFRADMVTLYTRVRSAHPVADIIIIMPPENVDPSRAPYPMAGYAQAMREWCIENQVPFIDLQPFFGVDLDYGPDGDFPLLIDNVHPNGSTGGSVIVSAIEPLVLGTTI